MEMHNPQMAYTYRSRLASSTMIQNEWPFIESVLTSFSRSR